MSVLSRAIESAAQEIVQGISDITDDVPQAMIERILWENMQQVEMDLQYWIDQHDLAVNAYNTLKDAAND